MLLPSHLFATTKSMGSSGTCGRTCYRRRHGSRGLAGGVCGFALLVVGMFLLYFDRTATTTRSIFPRAFGSTTTARKSGNNANNSTGGTATISTMGGVQAMATASTTQRRQHRILCYGDSLTAGYVNGMEMFPYAPHLESALKREHGYGDGDGDGPDVVVRHRGMPGWTAKNMMEVLDDEQTGVRSAIRRVQDPPLSLVIVLAGTNDMGYGYPADDIYGNIRGLHEACYGAGVPRTIAVGIPPSGYQSVNEGAARLASDVNGRLREYCETQRAGQATYVEFPFPYEKNGENWYTDTLHFSPRGYQVLGESLAPVVARILASLDDS